MAASMKTCRSDILRNISRKIRLLSTSSQCKQVSEQTAQKEKLSHPPASSNVGKDNFTEIVIPKRKYRDSTSILKALASTVERDQNAPSYFYIDDPFLTPKEFSLKRNYALSKASGKRAARYVLEQYPDFFQNEMSNPKERIEAFMPQKTTYSITEPGEAALKERIEMRKTLDAISVYKEIKLQELEVSEEVLHDLLDLLCVYNSEDPTPHEYPEEMFYPPKPEQRRLQKTWKDDGEAEKLFEELPEKTPRAYNTLVTGMATYLASEKAMDLYAEMVENKIPVEVPCYNKLIRFGSLVEDRHDSRWQIIKKFLVEMSEQGLKPDLETFNSIFFSLSYMSYYHPTPNLAMQTLAEMKKCGIEPSLGCFKCVIELFYQNENCQSDILEKIIHYLWDKKFEYTSPDDIDFFQTAMLRCHNVLKDVELAYKIETLARRNEDFLGNAFKRTLFYSCYFRLLCMYDSLERVMEEYTRLVPHSWFPSFMDFEEFFKTVDLYDGYEHLPQIWADIAFFDFNKMEKVVTGALSLMAKKSHPEQLQNQLCDIAGQLITRWINDQTSVDEIYQLQLSAVNMSDLIQISVNGNRFEQAWSAFTSLSENPKLFHGAPSEKAYASLVDLCIENQEPQKAIEVVAYMSDQALPSTTKCIDKVQSKLTLTDQQKDQLSKF